MRFKVEKGRTSSLLWGESSVTSVAELIKSESSRGYVPGKVIGEVYAYVGPTESDRVGAHHDILPTGDVLLSKQGLLTACAELVKNTALNVKQKRHAAAHLVRHFGELREDAPEDLLALTGESAVAQQFKPLGLEATLLSTQVKPSDIVPVLSPGVDLDALKKGDSDPLEVVVALPVGKSTRKWNYTAQALIEVVGEVNSSTAAGFLGHQDPDKVDHEFLSPVTHWIGARFDPDAQVRDQAGATIGKGVAYFRGVIDAAATDLKRWIRTRRVTQTSIYGIPTLRTVGGEVNVVGYRLLSIDWTPLKRAGMPSAIVAMGEMDRILGHVDVPNKLRSGGASTMAKRTDGTGATGEQSTTDDGNDQSGSETTTTIQAGSPGTGGQRIELVMPERHSSAQDLYSDLRGLKVPATAVIGEMGWKPEDFVPQLGLTLAQLGQMVDPAEFAELTASRRVVGEMATVLGLEEGWKADDVIGQLRALREQQEQVQQATLERTINEVIGEMVITAQARPLVKRLIPAIPLTSTKNDVMRVVGEMLSDVDVKTALSTVFRESVVQFSPENGRDGDGATTTLTRTRKTQI